MPCYTACAGECAARYDQRTHGGAAREHGIAAGGGHQCAVEVMSVVFSVRCGTAVNEIRSDGFVAEGAGGIGDRVRRSEEVTVRKTYSGRRYGAFTF